MNDEIKRQFWIFGFMLLMGSLIIAALHIINNDATIINEFNKLRGFING